MSTGPSVDTTIVDQTARTLLETTLGFSTPLNTNIHPNDQMFSFIASVRGNAAVATSEYLTSGVQLLKTLDQLVRWKFGSFEDVGSLLDFASGYGRLTRFLVHRMPTERVWVSDIQADAVAFQRAEFGVNGFASTANPADLHCDHTFDCIFVASLFSHLPGAKFTAWLKKLYRLLNPGGLLVFSANDVSRLPAGETMPESGIWFGSGSEVASLHTSEYGTTVVTEAYVRDAMVAATGQPTYHRIPYGLFYAQDLYVATKDPTPDFSGLRFTYLPHGTVDYGMWTGDGELYLRGWAVDLSSGPTALKLQFFSGNRLLQECTPTVQRPDVQASHNDARFSQTGWECSLPVPKDGHAQPLLIKALPESGKESILYVGDVAALTPRGKVESCWWVGRDVLHLVGWAVDPTGDWAQVEVQVIVEGTLRQKCIPYIHRPELQQYLNDDRFLYSGWECTVRVPDYAPWRNIVVRSVSHSGVESILYIGGIATLERQAGTSHETWHDELTQRLEYIRHLEAEVARKNAAVGCPRR